MCANQKDERNYSYSCHCGDKKMPTANGWRCSKCGCSDTDQSTYSLSQTDGPNYPKPWRCKEAEKIYGALGV